MWPDQRGADGYDSPRIRDLDPLGADAALAKVPEMNTRRDQGALVRLLSDIMPSPADLAAMTFHGAVAAMRDIGLLLGSIKRHGLEPVEAVAGLEPILVDIGRRTGMVPRDTIHHYTEFNPRGARRRTYTGNEQERYLIAAPTLALEHIPGAVRICEQLNDEAPGWSEMPTLLRELGAEVGVFDAAMGMIRDTVAPEFFAQILRPYFEPVRVGSTNYLGPAASHVPLFLVDLALWASDQEADQYTQFRREAEQYTLPPWRAKAEQWEGSASLATKIADTLQTMSPTEPVPPDLRETAIAMGGVLHTLILFRGKHLAFARKTYRDETCAHEVGSGGGSIDLLDSILSLTRENADVTHFDGGSRMVAGTQRPPRSRNSSGWTPQWRDRQYQPSAPPTACLPVK